MTERLHIDLSEQEPIPAAGVEAALALMKSGKLHRYGETDGKPSAVSQLEAAFAAEMGLHAVHAANQQALLLERVDRQTGRERGGRRGLGPNADR